MKIRVTTKAWEYQGLYEDSIQDVETFYEDRGKVKEVTFKLNGKSWNISCCDFEVVEECRRSCCECEAGECSGGKVDMRADEVAKVNSKGVSEKKIPIKSDGGSSSYYDIDIPDWLLNLLNERQKEGKCYIKTEELIECAFDSDFDFANAFKSLVRAFGARNGGGKAGNDVDYEMNKVQYSANKIKQRNQRKGEIGE